MTRRDLLKAAFGSGAMLLLAACGNQPAAPAPTAAPAKPAEAKPTEAAKPAAPAQAAPAATTAPAAPAAQPAATVPPSGQAAPAAAAQKPQVGGQLRAAIQTNFTTMDPHLSSSSSDRQVYQSIYDTLVRLDKDLKIQPGLAKSWEQPDPKTIVFKLQPGVKYHDGEPFNAASVKANLERMTNHPKSLRKSEIVDIASVEVVDDLTVKLSLKQPSSPLLSLLTDRAGMMVSVKAAEAVGDDFARKPVGTGPFTFVEWLTDDHLTVRKNAQYWGKDASGVQLPYLDEVIYKPIPDQGQRVTALKTGTVDILDTASAKDVPGLRSATDLVASEVPGLAFRYMQLNTKQAPMDSLPIRQAIAWAVDRETINKAIFFNIGQPAYQAIPPSSFAFDPEFKANSPRDVAKGKALVAQSSIANPTFACLIANTPDDKQLAEVLKEELADVGITMNIELIESAAQIDRTNKLDFTATVTGWSGRPDPDGNVYLYFHSKGSSNRSQWANADVDKALEQTRAVSDPAERKKLYAAANKIIAEESPMIFIQHRAELKAMSKKVQGFVHVPDGMIRVTQLSLKS